jgi:hypothetical protein
MEHCQKFPDITLHKIPPPDLYLSILAAQGMELRALRYDPTSTAQGPRYRADSSEFLAGRLLSNRETLAAERRPFYRATRAVKNTSITRIA